MDATKRVLLVSSDGGLTGRLADRLETDGFEVTLCPGPLAPDYVCIGPRSDACVLADEADAVVVDGWLKSDQVRHGTPSWHLARYYWGRGLPVVLLVGPDGLPPGIT